MRLSTLVALLFPLTSYPIAYFAQTRLHPRTATWLMSLAAMVLALAGTFTLGVLAVHAALRVPQVERMIGLSGTTLAANEHTTVTVSLIAAAALGFLLTLTVGFTARYTRTLTRSFAYARNLPGNSPLVVTDDVEADAYSVPGSPSRIVVSSGMLAALDDAQQQALVAHEDSHLRNRHYIFASITRFAAIVNPLVRPLAAGVTFSLERWADEDAADATADRELVAAAISRAAIARKHGARRRADLLVFSIVDAFRGTHRRLGPVPRRVSALLAPAPTNSWAAISGALIGLIVATAYAVGAGAHLHELIQISRAAK